MYSLNCLWNSWETSLSGRPLSYVLYLDDFTIQETDALKEKVACVTRVIWGGLRNTTGQVVDAAIALILKILVGKEHPSWLSESYKQINGMDMIWQRSPLRTGEYLSGIRWIGLRTKICKPFCGIFTLCCWKKKRIKSFLSVCKSINHLNIFR